MFVESRFEQARGSIRRGPHSRGGLYARELIRTEGLEGRCTVELCDYRDLSGIGGFDKIASVGMFEHVGLKNLPAYFCKIRSLLSDKGLVLNHGITTSDVDSQWIGLGAGDFIDRYVFPDGELPHLSVVLKEMSAAGLEVADVESLRRHYARTCHEWASRLECNRERAAALAGEKRLRIWQIYLAGCAYGFANGWMNIYQVLGPSRSIGSKPRSGRDEGASDRSGYCVRAEDDEDVFVPAQYLTDQQDGPSDVLEREETNHLRTSALKKALASLDSRSRRIIESRWLREENAATLHDLADELKVSAERIRQIESKALLTMRKAMDGQPEFRDP